MASDLSIRALDESTWPAYAALAEGSGGFPSGCWCMGFHPEGIPKDFTAELNRGRKRERVLAGTAHAALVLEGGFTRDRMIGKHRWVVKLTVPPAS